MNDAVLYLLFSAWLIATVLVARGALALLGSLVPIKYVSWALLPGTLLSELAYLLGCLVTGAQVRVGKLIDNGDGRGDKADQAEARKGVPFLTPLLTGLLPVAVCLIAIFIVSDSLDHPVFTKFYLDGIDVPRYDNPTPDMVWDVLIDQVKLVRDSWRALSQTLRNWPWENWRGWLFEYLMICLVLRLAPARRPLRPVLLGAVVAAGIIAAAVAISGKTDWFKSDLWRLLSYTYATAGLLLFVALIVRGVVGLAKILAGK